ncbi:hypothetical protein BT96DRAFT_964467 [Gymnopus androsaceus JB14]|uniref:Wax synthase domain-containing protein n=1 Tax=Gymnopus androsaceus JB14 TaxID=1447944 RepID=A0A6A4I4G1_9AGAR|nr:hypothetical protein BT96DRAFT_964467 [Gymnopus androsaceus JB14]
MSRADLCISSFFFVFLPPLVGYFCLAALVCLPGTNTARIGLLPLVLFFSYLAATTLDLSFANERTVYFNKGLVLAMTALGFRVIIWASSKAPYKRLSRRGVDSEETSPGSPLASNDWKQLSLDAFDLAFNLRGIGWDWSQSIHVPLETRPTSTKIAFVSWTLASLCLHLPILDLLHYTVQRFGPGTFGTVIGGSIFDESLPPLIRYSRSTLITFLSGLVVYCAIQIVYDISTIFGIVVLRQLPTQWPPVFDEPWKATSLSEFWAKRWHTLFRQLFVGIGGGPGYALFGRIGGVLGAFFVSGLLHYIGLFGLGNGSDVLGMIGFFVFNGCGIILEAFWKRHTGHRVGGWLGRIWTYVWLLLWANFLVDGWAQKGLIGALFFPDAQRLPVKIFGPLPSS